MKAKVIAIDETEYLREDLKEKVGKWVTFYAFHTGIVTRICSFTPSYWLIPVGNYAENEIDDDLFSELVSVNESDYYTNILKVEGEEYDLDEDDLDDVNIPELVDYLTGNQADYEWECLQAIGIDYKIL